MDIDRPQSLWLSSDAVITMGVLLLVFAAFDDITTDNAATFTVEYTALALGGAWLLGLAIRLMRQGRAALGGISLVALAAAVWGQRVIGPGGAASDPHYIAVLAAFAWFLLLSLVLLVVGWGAHPDNVAERAG